MKLNRVIIAAVSIVFPCAASIGWADVPAPPVNQSLGMLDTVFGELVEADCRTCHDIAVPDRHHLLYGEPIPPGSFVPYPDADGDGNADTHYGCLNCHDEAFTVVSDCIVCHTSNAHHRTAASANLDCVSCHGDIVDNVDDGHYIPSYPTSDVTPKPDDGKGLPLNSRLNGAGACDYCHDNDTTTDPMIATSSELHHAVSYVLDGTLDCLVCHAIEDESLAMRVCERCHGPDSLHNIQADSPAPENIGTVVVGGEYAGYGHVGRDAGPGDSDCWGCHGFQASSAPQTGPIIPTVYRTDPVFTFAGSETTIILEGASFVNIAMANYYDSDVQLTGMSGETVTLTPDIILDEGALIFTIPGNTAPGNYRVRAIKDEFASNPAVISIVPQVKIARASVRLGQTTIRGSGFGGYAAGSGTEVTGTYIAYVRGRPRTRTMTGSVISWTDSRIVVTFPETPRSVTVQSIFGLDRYTVRSQ